MSRKILIAYYSQSGNTEKLAKMIQNEVGGALYSIGDENAGSAGVEAYDTFFVGTPNWSGTLTAPVKEFLSKNDLSGKTVVPFCTHGMGGLQNVAADIEKLCAASTVLTCLPIKGVEVDSAPEKVKNWLADIGII